MSIEMIPITQVDMGDHRHPAYGFHWSSWPPETGMPTVDRVGPDFDGSAEHVTEAGARYVALLRELVHEFRRAHIVE